MNPKIIGLVGNIRSGKSTVGDLLVRDFGYKLASNSDVLREIAGRLDMLSNRVNLKRLGDAIFESLGNDAIANVRIKDVGSFPIVVDGIRYLEEVAVYRREPTFRLFGVVANSNTRYERARALSTNCKDGNISRSDFEKLALSRSEMNVPALLELADVTITNDGSLENLLSLLEQALNA